MASPRRTPQLWTRFSATSEPRNPSTSRIVRGFEGLDVGDRIRVTLQNVDSTRGFIDFTR